MENHTFKAGAAQVDITPPLGTIINGEFTSCYANEIADPLYTTALVRQDEATTRLVIMVDTCAMQRDFLDAVKELIQGETGIPPQHQLIASTHTQIWATLAQQLTSYGQLV